MLFCAVTNGNSASMFNGFSRDSMSTSESGSAVSGANISVIGTVSLLVSM